MTSSSSPSATVLTSLAVTEMAFLVTVFVSFFQSWIIFSSIRVVFAKLVTFLVFGCSLFCLDFLDGWLFSPLFPGRIGIWKCWFLWKEGNRSTQRKTLGTGMRTNNKVNPHMMPRPGIGPGPHWWKRSPLTTVPSLLPHNTL